MKYLTIQVNTILVMITARHFTKQVKRKQTTVLPFFFYIVPRGLC